MSANSLVRLRWRQSHPRLRALYVFSIRQARCLTLTSFRFHLTMDTLALCYVIPAIRAHSGLTSIRQHSCRVYKKPLKIVCFSGVNTTRPRGSNARGFSNEFNLIFRKFLADSKNFSELCDEVCMYAIIVLRCLGTAKLLKIQ